MFRSTISARAVLQRIVFLSESTSTSQYAYSSPNLVNRGKVEGTPCTVVAGSRGCMSRGHVTWACHVGWALTSIGAQEKGRGQGLTWVVDKGLELWYKVSEIHQDSLDGPSW